MDFERISSLLNVVHMTLEMPDLRFIRDAAIAELRAMAPTITSPSPTAAPIFPKDSGTTVVGDGSETNLRRV